MKERDLNEVSKIYVVLFGHKSCIGGECDGVS